MITVWGPLVWPVAMDTAAFFPWLLDHVDEVIANHPNTLAQAILAIEAKLNIDNEPVLNVGGVQFFPTGKPANPSPPGSPSVWVDNTTVGGFAINYTDELGVTYDLRSGSGSIGEGYTCPMGTVDGDLVFISAPDTVIKADAVVGNQAHGMVVRVYGGGTTCDIAYGSEITNLAWVLVPGAVYYLGVAGVFAAAPPFGWTVQQEIGFARNVTTMVFRPTIVTT